MLFTLDSWENFVPQASEMLTEIHSPCINCLYYKQSLHAILQILNHQVQEHSFSYPNYMFYRSKKIMTYRDLKPFLKHILFKNTGPMSLFSLDYNRIIN